LNPLLHRRLVQRFGSVKTLHAGEAMSARACTDAHTGKPKLLIRHAGEYYAVACPFCSDTRYRLWINHRYGQRDAFGRRLTFLAVCYNETACMDALENQQALWHMLSATEGMLEGAPLREGRHVPEEARRADWPGPCTRLDRLEARHPARLYLESRGFDPDLIGRFYGAAYCHDSVFFLAKDRICIPVYERGALKGWQARYIGERNWKEKTGRLLPKYFTCPGMPRRLLLYNLDAARHYETGVLVEGPTDVWSVGPMAVCTFGASMSPEQERKFLRAFRDRTAVVLYDPDALRTKPTLRLVKALRAKMPGRVAVVELPEGADPGSLGRAVLRDYVAAAAAAQGVPISYLRQDAPTSL
jgi:hypothetical protein